MEIIEQIGAYAGLAAVLGLAVLSALYFSQARDVKRLREWAGRAPERVAEGATADQLAQGVVAQPQPRVVQEAGAAPAVPGPKPGPPAAKPATPAATPPTPAAKPAAAAATGAVPATAAAAKASPAQAAAKPGAPAPSSADTDTADTKAPADSATPAGGGAKTPATPGTPGTPAATPGTPGTPAGTPAPATAAAAAPGSAPARPAAKPAPRPPVRPTVPLPSQSGRPAPSQTAILPPRQEKEPAYTRLLESPRYLMLAIAGILIVGGAVAFGAVQLTKDDEGGTPAVDTQDLGTGSGDDGGDQRRLPPVSPGSVTVSVLNGTTIPGLAASIGDEVERFGFVLGNVDNSADQGARNESVVMFAPEHEREAVAVGRRLQIAQREPIDPESQAIAGDAGVVVIVGSDKTQ